MTIDQAVVGALKTDAALSAAIGSIHWEVASKGTKTPAVVVQQLIDPNQEELLDTNGGSATLQLDIYGAEQAETAEVRPVLKAAIRRIRGMVSGFNVSRSKITNEFSQGPQPTTGYYRFTIEAVVEYTE